jgi:hypothetical protein
MSHEANEIAQNEYGKNVSFPTKSILLISFELLWQQVFQGKFNQKIVELA